MISALVLAVLAALALMAAIALVLLIVGIHHEPRWARPSAAPPSAIAAITRRVLGLHVLSGPDPSDEDETREKTAGVRR